MCMKKVLLIGLLLVLAISLVVAQGQPNETGKPEETGQPEESGQPEDAGKPEDVGMPNNESRGKPEAVPIAAGKDVEKVEGVPKGLTVALSRVKNENASQRLQLNIQQFQERYKERLQKMEGLEIEDVDEETGAVKLKAKVPVRFFGFIKGKATKRFNINAEGQIEEKAPWYRFLYREVE